MPSRAQQIALRSSLIYAVIGALWIVGSDRAVAVMTRNSAELLWLQTYKGFAFVLTTAVLMYYGLRAQIRRAEIAAAARESAAKNAEAALRERAEANARLAHIAAVVPGAIVSYHRGLDGKMSLSYASAAIEEIYGLPQATLAADMAEAFKLIHPEDVLRARATIEQSAQDMAPWRCEFRFQHPTKGEVWIEGHSLPEKQADGSLRWNGFVMDITARKRAELRVHQLNRVYAVLSEINGTIVRVRDSQALLEAVCRIAVEKGKFRMAWIGRCDEATHRIVPVAHAGAVAGYLDDLDISCAGPAESLGPTGRAAVTGRHVVVNDMATDATLAPWREQALARGYRASAALPIRVNGRVAGVLNLYSAEPHVFDHREIQLLDDLTMDLGFALEVGEREAGRLRTEAFSRENEDRFRQLAENIHEVFWLTDPNTRRVLYASPVYETIWGRTVESLYAEPRQWFDSIHPEDRQRVMTAVVERETSGSYDEEYRVLRPDGTIRWVRARVFPVRDTMGNVYRLAGVAEDISDRKKLEEQFFRAQRLEAIGTLASGIAHDMNNILAPIMMCAPMLRMGLPPPEFEKMLVTIEASTRRGADLVRQLLVFGRGVEGGRGPVNARDLIDELLKIACETFPKNIDVRSEVAEGLWMVLGDATQLHQVLLNLCVNARDAMPQGGRLTVAADNLEMDAAGAARLPNARPGAYVRLRVSDTGSGISPEHVDQIFDPFFTTKPVGQGTGLGLSTVLGIVKSHNGFVRLESEVGRGSVFEIYLPAQTNCAAVRPVSGVESLPRGHGELVLLVEDEESIRDVVADLLIRQNYRVMTAEDGVEGDTLLKENLEDIALIITDLDMPRMDGFRFIEAVRRVSAKLPVVVSTGLRSGRTAEDRMSDLEQLGVSAVLAKPYATVEILNAVNNALLGKK